jgi:Flp pilus assembly pilin Flp
MTIRRQRREAGGAAVLEYALMLAMVLLVVFASIYALGQTPERPARVLTDTLTSSGGSGGGDSVPGPSTSVPCSTTTTAPAPTSTTTCVP